MDKLRLGAIKPPILDVPDLKEMKINNINENLKSIDNKFDEEIAEIKQQTINQQIQIDELKKQTQN